MELIYTDVNNNELGYLKCTIDLEIGKYKVASNDFEISLSSNSYDELLKEGSLIYVENTEFGGIISHKKSDTSKNTISFMGKTFRGLLEKEYVQPPNGQAYFNAKGEANSLIDELIVGRFGNLVVVDNIGLSDIKVNYQIRDINLLQALERMLYRADIPSRLDIKFYDGQLHLQALPIVDLSDLLRYDNAYGLTMIATTHDTHFNHILALGEGELTERLRVNLYMKKTGEWTTDVKNAYYKGFDKKTYKYDNSNISESSELIDSAIEAVEDANTSDTLSMTFTSDDAELDDIVGAKEEITGIEFKEQITAKILKGSFDGERSNIGVSYKIGG